MLWGGGGGGGGGGNETPFGYLKTKKIVPATLWHKALRCGEAWLRNGVELYLLRTRKCDKGYTAA